MESNPDTNSAPSVPEFVSNGEFVKIAEIGEIGTGDRKRIVVDKRDVTVFCPKPNVMFAIDSVCYHTGGPLEEGDIEDVAGRMCIVCPWHRYKIDLCTGEGLFVDLKGNVSSKGKRQRAHPVQTKDDGIYIQVHTEQSTGEKLPSDHYAYKELYKNKRGIKMGPIHSKKPPMSL